MRGSTHKNASALSAWETLTRRSGSLRLMCSGPTV